MVKKRKLRWYGLWYGEDTSAGYNKRSKTDRKTDRRRDGKVALDKSSILPHNGFNNLFPTVQETNHFMEVGWLKKKKKKKKKNEIHCDVPVSDMRHAFRAAQKLC